MTTYKYSMAQGGRNIKGEYKIKCKFVDGLLSEYWDSTAWQRRATTWGHRATLYKDGVQVARCTYKYYNRTWERYTYESVIRGVVERYKQKLIKQACEDERERTENGRLPRGFKKTYSAMIDVAFKNFVESIKENKLEKEF